MTLYALPHSHRIMSKFQRSASRWEWHCLVGITHTNQRIQYEHNRKRFLADSARRIERERTTRNDTHELWKKRLYSTFHRSVGISNTVAIARSTWTVHSQNHSQSITTAANVVSRNHRSILLTKWNIIYFLKTLAKMVHKVADKVRDNTFI